MTQQIVLDFRQYAAEESFKKFMSHFYNQMSVTIDQKTERDGSTIDFNPFQQNSENVIGQNNAFKNILFYNRGQRNLSTAYTFSEVRTKIYWSLACRACKARCMNYSLNMNSSHYIC